MRGAGLRAVLSDRLKFACSALVAAGRGLTLGIALGVKGLGGVLSILRRTLSRLLSLQSGLFGMSDIDPNTPAYVIPLTDKQLLTLGRITALWAQVDFFAERLLMLVHDLNPAQYEILFGDKMVSTKLEHLERSLVLIGDPKRKAALSLLLSSPTKVKGDRNHATHGLWGRRTTKTGDFIAARASRTPCKPLRAERLK